MLYAKTGDDAKAHTAFQTVVKMYPSSDAATFAHDQLEALAEKADPAAGLFVNAQDLYRRGEVEGAIRAYEQIIAKHPSSKLLDNAYFGLGMINFYRGDKAKAREFFKIVRERFPDSDAAKLIAQHDR
jgi:TolA-binding protein